MISDTLVRVGARGYRATCILGLLLSAGIALGACGGEPSGESIGHEDGAIINGTVNTTHHAVVAVMSSNTSCSGTIIHVDAAQGIGHVLSAAHCDVPLEIRQGTNYNNPSAVYSVIDWQNHPNYDPQSALFDFKMIRFVGASGSTPVLPAMTPAQDDLAAGTSVRHIGYGLAGPAPGSNNSQRREFVGTLSGVGSSQISYNQPNGGPCSGDSGGPQLTLGTERVAGVTSYGDQNCAVNGVSGRVSAVYDNFIVPYINGSPTGPLTCDQCTQAATSGQGACMPQVNACLNNNNCTTLLNCFDSCGNNNNCLQQCINDNPTGWGIYEQIFTCVCDTGCVQECMDEAFCNGGGTVASSSSVASSGSGDPSATSGSGAGAGGAGATSGAGAGNVNGNGWTAGDVEDKDYSGHTFSSCSAPASPARGGAGWLALLGLIGVGVATRRRRDLRA